MYVNLYLPIHFEGYRKTLGFHGTSWFPALMGDRVSLAGWESHAKYIRGVVQGKYACRKASRRSKFRGQGATTQVVRTGASLISISL